VGGAHFGLVEAYSECVNTRSGNAKSHSVSVEAHSEHVEAHGESVEAHTTLMKTHSRSVEAYLNILKLTLGLIQICFCFFGVGGANGASLWRCGDTY
jgi:hypothetical protein